LDSVVLSASVSLLSSSVPTSSAESWIQSEIAKAARTIKEIYSVLGKKLPHSFASICE